MTPDREALIHAIELRENIAKRDHHGFVDLPYEMVGNVLAMLKEQETQKFLVDESGKITPLPVVVRCKDCKYHGNICPDYCVNLEQNTNDDFYCADGERKELCE